MALLLGLALAPADAAETRSSIPGAEPPAASVADLSWMVGTWEGTGLGGTVLENYSPIVAGQMPGHFRAVNADGTPMFYEFMTVAQVAASIEYRVKHFRPDMTGWEEKAEVVRFPLVAVDKDVWYFDGLTIRRTGPDSVTHHVRVDEKDGGSHEIVFNYRRSHP